MNSRHIFIINPQSGHGEGKMLAESIETVCRQRGYSYAIHFTTKEHTATRIAAECAKEETDCVFWAVGGDGTLHEVLNGMAESGHRLALLPVGSGNDFYRTLLACGAPKGKLDIGRINDRYFINTVCFGLDGQVANNLDRMRKRWIPVSQRYTASIVYTFLTYREQQMKVSCENKTDVGRHTMLTICNGRYYGGGYEISSDERLDDGWFGMYCTGRVSRPRVIWLLLQLQRGRLRKSQAVQFSRVQKLQIAAEEEIICNVDGERMQAKEFSISMLPEAVSFYEDRSFMEQVIQLKKGGSR